MGCPWMRGGRGKGINMIADYVDRVDHMWVTPNVVAAEIGVHPETVRRWLKQGKIKGVKFGRQWRVAVEEFERIVREGVDDEFDDGKGGVMVAAPHL